MKKNYLRSFAFIGGSFFSFFVFRRVRRAVMVPSPRISLANLGVLGGSFFCLTPSRYCTVQDGVANLGKLRIVNRYFSSLAGGGPRDV
jgi:hypothetical protein